MNDLRPADDSRNDASDGVRVRRVDDRWREAVVRRLLAGRPQFDATVAQVLQEHESGLLPLNGLLVAERSTVPPGSSAGWLGVAVYTLGRDGSANLWPPVAESLAVRGRLLAAAIAAARSEGAGYVQLLAAPEGDDDPLFARHLFAYTDLQFLTLDASGLAMAATRLRSQFSKDLPSLHARLFREEDREEWVRLLARSFDGSRDCPEICTLRTTEQALLSIELTGHTSTSGWRAYGRAPGDSVEEAVGLAMATHHQAVDVRELAYIGVRPSARRQGIARAMLLDVFTACLRDGCGALVVSVDCGNTPAVSLYRSLGFEFVERQRVWLDVDLRSGRRPL